MVPGLIGTRRCQLESFAAIVFIIPGETVLIESLLSVMNYNKDKTRSSLADTSVANIIHTKYLEPVLADAKQAFSPEIVLNMKPALEQKLAF